MKILAHSFVNSEGVFLNGKIIAEVENSLRFQTDLYRKLNLNYPKFHKMDGLSKSALLADFVLKETYESCNNLEDKLQIVMANEEASKQTDLKFEESYGTKENASPSLFVYTLPNIVTGELAIKNKWFGENTFFILPKFDASFFHLQAQLAFRKNSDYCLCGWLENTKDNNQECLLILMANSPEELRTEEIDNIFNTYKK